MVNDRAGLGEHRLISPWKPSCGLLIMILPTIYQVLFLCHTLYIQSMNDAKNQAFLTTMQKRKLKLKEAK